MERTTLFWPNTYSTVHGYSPGHRYRLQLSLTPAPYRFVWWQTVVSEYTPVERQLKQREAEYTVTQ